METPSSTRRVTRSQTRAALSSSAHNISVSKNGEDTEKNIPASRPKTAMQDRSALIDITNDSPIVGLAGRSSFLEMKTPLSSVAKQRKNVPKSTPGSGEALLRCQVKTLLQKVEEEAEISKFLGSVNHGHGPHFLGLRGFPNSPMGILAPTPTNTPQIPGSGEEPADEFASKSPIEDHLKISQVVSDLFDGKMVESDVDSEKSLITRSLLLDFSEKSDLSTVDSSLSKSSECSSVVTYQSSKEKSSSSSTVEDEEEEDASIWSIQVNASTRSEDEDLETEDEEEEEFCEDEDYEEEDEDGSIDELCAEMSKISVVGSSAEARFEGKHTRFLYNSDDEIEREEEVVHLKGLPTPKGKHLRFVEDEEDVSGFCWDSTLGL